jgi:DNA-directed RNA polymerase subunit K/omega
MAYTLSRPAFENDASVSRSPGNGSLIHPMNSTLLANAIAVVPHNELLVNMVRLRVRQLNQGARPLILAPPGMGLADIALSEIAANKLTAVPKVDASAEVAAPAAIISFPATAIAKKAA